MMCCNIVCNLAQQVNVLCVGVCARACVRLCLSVHLSVHLSVCLSVCLSVYSMSTCVCRALTEMQHDVKEAREAIAEVADNNAILAAVCLTEGATALDWSTTSHKPLHM